MSLSEKLFLPLYSAALRLYPRAFRARYATQMIDAARTSYSESNHPVPLTASLARDMATSLLREHWRAAHTLSPGYVAILAAFLTFVLFGASIIDQQVLRRGADRQPSQIVSSIAIRTAQGDNPAALIPGTHTEIADKAWLNGSQPFVVLYDNSGTAIAGNATLYGRLPQPPKGIFRHARSKGQDKVTWQPQPGIRVATITKPLPTGGFILAGQSIVATEMRTHQFDMLLRWIWLAMLATLIGTMAVVHRRTAS